MKRSSQGSEALISALTSCHFPSPWGCESPLHLTFLLPKLSALFLFSKDSLFHLLFFNCLFLEREGKEKERERNISVQEKHQCVVASRTPSVGTWPATQACALTRNWTSDLLILRPALSPLSHSSQGSSCLYASFSFSLLCLSFPRGGSRRKKPSLLAFSLSQSLEPMAPHLGQRSREALKSISHRQAFNKNFISNTWAMGELAHHRRTPAKEKQYLRSWSALLLSGAASPPCGDNDWSWGTSLLSSSDLLAYYTTSLTH